MMRTGRTPKRRATTQGRGQPASCDLQARYEHCLALARERETARDIIEAERLYQQADHYRRLLNAAAA